ncbi:probable basic-leucine zipper transcription factor Q [Drosophila busckii]|uniref:probable basic-leucine zipper transcription factor Q n=1 Tax=Drosophila busckii TaxID=30019 RepID=UPI00083F4E3E|nr:probable basic-leucine zipper transcription factor Q [Drosophila busckii]XP_017837654.1 probable basic-leucine zipper transcription factor Q [Drosophila busckii]XP_017837655.1 probable basic-leucine zipper transcription factor Q [Drosophila busckii]
MAQAIVTNANNVTNNNGSVDENEPFQISDDELEDLDDDCLLEEAEMGGSGGGVNICRGPYERAWTTEATRALIHIRGPMEGSFTEGRQKRTALWLHCTRQLQRLGFRYSAAKVQKKWHNILITYNKNLNKKYISGYVHWEFFEEMFKYLQGKKADFDMQLPAATAQQPQQQSAQQQPQAAQQQPQPAIPQLQAQASATQEAQAQAYITPVDQVLLQPQVQLDSKSNDEFDEDSNSLSEVRQPKLEYDADQTGSTEQDNNDSNQMAMTANGKLYEQAQPLPQLQSHNADDIWWKDYFERKLEVEREKMELQRSLTREQVQIQKMSLVQQERMERMKIDAINSLTATLQKLVEAKCRRA